jgi:hypothetical protein
MMLAMALAVALHDIAWLAGQWLISSPTQCVEEQWIKPSSNMRTRRSPEVSYRREGDGGLAARIEGENGGKPFAEDYPYRRVSNSAASRCGAVP